MNVLTARRPRRIRLGQILLTALAALTVLTVFGFTGVGVTPAHAAAQWRCTDSTLGGSYNTPSYYVTGLAPLPGSWPVDTSIIPVVLTSDQDAVNSTTVTGSQGLPAGVSVQDHNGGKALKGVPTTVDSHAAETIRIDFQDDVGDFWCIWNNPLTVAKIATSTALTGPPTATVGVSVSVSGTSSGIPNGTPVSFVDVTGGGSIPVGSGSVHGNAISGTLIMTTAGARQVAARWAGSDTHEAATTTSVGVTVAKIATSTALTGPTSATVGTSVSVTGTSTNIPDGTSVDVVDVTGGGSIPVGSGSVHGNAISGTLIMTTAGARQVAARWAGSDTHEAATTTSVGVTVAKIATATALTGPTSATVGTSVSVTGTSTNIPDGTSVDVVDVTGGGSIPVGSGSVHGNAISGTLIMTTAGARQVAARWAGSDTHEAATTTAVTMTVSAAAKIATSTALTGPPTATVGVSVSVSGTSSGIPNGTPVSFVDVTGGGSIPVGSGSVHGNAISGTLIMTTAGARQVAARWAGSDTHEAATTTSVGVTVAKIATATALTGPTSATVGTSVSVTGTSTNIPDGTSVDVVDVTGVARSRSGPGPCTATRSVER
ncbi:MAG: hypothetical protein IPM90_06410 [Austwickia sp.]|nr:hypothetical protein [Austwickia sp.]